MSRADFAGRFEELEHRTDSMEHRLDASFAALSGQIVQSHRETRDEISALRGEMRAMAGDLRGEMKAMGDALNARLRDQHEEMYSLHALTNGRFDKLESSVAETHRHMLVLHEEVLSRFALFAEWRRG